MNFAEPYVTNVCILIDKCSDPSQSHDTHLKTIVKVLIDFLGGHSSGPLVSHRTLSQMHQPHPDEVTSSGFWTLGRKQSQYDDRTPWSDVVHYSGQDQCLLFHFSLSINVILVHMCTLDVRHCLCLSCSRQRGQYLISLSAGVLTMSTLLLLCRSAAPESA